MNALTTLPSEAAPRIAVPARFDPTSQALHWLSVVLIAALFASAWSLGLAQGGAAAGALLTLHRSLGVSLLGVALTRMLWRIGFAVRPPLPRTMSETQKTAAAVTETGLYVLMLGQPLTGLAQSVARGKPFQLFVFQAPRLMARDKGLASLFHNIHELGAWVLLGLIGLHVAAALFHGLVRRDGVLGSMWPWPVRKP